MLVDGKQKTAHWLVLFVHQHLFIAPLLFVSPEIAWKPPIEFHKQHLSIAKEVGDRAAEGRVCGNLGTAYHCLCEFNPKIIPFRKSCSAALRNSVLSFTLDGWLLRDMMFSWTNHSARISVIEEDIF